MNKPLRWSIHAEDALVDRHIARDDVIRTIASPEFRVPDKLPPNEVCMRRYLDADLGRTALMRVVIHETELEIAVVTVYKVTNMRRYLRGLVP